MTDKLRILIVDDFPDTWHPFAQRLKSKGVPVYFAKTISQARLEMEERNFGILLIDDTLHVNGDGMMWAKELHAHDQIVILCGHRFWPEAKEVPQQPKPINTDELLAQILYLSWDI